MKSKLCLLAFLCPLFILAQQPSVSIGDKLPQSLSKKIPSSKNKLLILDFFATWCSSCAKKMPLLDSLQAQFGNRISITLVSSYGTGDTEQKISSFFQRRKKTNGASYTFPVICNDTILKATFSHNAVPHYVWIYNNRLIAITSSAQVNAQNISAVLKKQPVSLPVKNDQQKQKAKNQ